MNIRYKGPLIADTCIPGEGKSEGIIPEISCCVQASRDKWLILFGTVDPRGHDTNRSIFYQLRGGAPDGDVLKEGIIEKARSGWDPLGVGHQFRKVNGLVKAFGVPKGALRNGAPIPSANHFVVKWYVRPSLEIDGLLVSPNRVGWPPEIDVAELGIAAGLEWLQFRLNEAEDDIEVTMPAKPLRQKGYEKGEGIASIGPGKHMHHGFAHAVPEDDGCSDWAEVCQFGDRLAAVRYTFDPARGLYEWVKTGNAQSIPERQMAEASLNKIDNDWVISTRAYNQEGQTAWYRTSDPFESFGDNRDVKCSYVPRISYVCADGVLRLFGNDHDLSPYGDQRNPLYCFDVDPASLAYSNRHVVLDAREEGMPFYIPFVDHAMLFPHAGGNKQIVSFRVMTHKQTNRQSDDPDTTPDELAHSGIHYSELIYDEDYSNPWKF